MIPKSVDAAFREKVRERHDQAIRHFNKRSVTPLIETVSQEAWRKSCLLDTSLSLLSAC
jgi:hypothetical protein